ncbi:putative serine/threonine protein kinase [Aspergillus nomiae NRRL 13137]|uniref:Putative serine/threonine protein kinase n=1 Tax=Aspergillus nomiae NRRL (strain ATCC 15546 / NRRL 13137 / CBS 260.88 / M93) TaxID=1509407 RepID=A0A0L1J921_ASPN3|nr:putative serine/threonine protein kinase [Aspergillus nomiae NRRL 13137]KNG88190.1 putative serine/threonine protein kinase [Aspergillus nomiae NRRL 13137]
METPWGSPADIWSYGTMLISLIYGGATVPYGHEEYNLEVLTQQFRYFGPWPGKYEEVESLETLHAIRWIMQEIPKSETTPFAMITEKEVCKRDKEFIMEIMKLDWRDSHPPGSCWSMNG